MAGSLSWMEWWWELELLAGGWEPGVVLDQSVRQGANMRRGVGNTRGKLKAKNSIRETKRKKEKSLE